MISDTPGITVVIPVFNEAQIVRGAVEDLARRLDALGWSYELVLTENGSTDGTQQILADLSRQFPQLRPLHGEEPNYGKALKRGIIEARGAVVICDEIDLCDVDFYQRALPLLEGGADMVVGSKAMRGAADGRPLIPAAGRGRSTGASSHRIRRKPLRCYHFGAIPPGSVGMIADAR